MLFDMKVERIASQIVDHALPSRLVELFVMVVSWRLSFP